jgi:LytS/YehU family sensor histidine kinase
VKTFLKYKLDHVFFWLATILFHLYTKLPLLQKTSSAHLAIEVLVRNGLLAVVVYVNFLWLVPQFLKTKKYVQYLVLILALLSFYALGKNVHDQYLYNSLITTSPQMDIYNKTLYNFSIGLFYLAFSTTLLLSKDWFVQREELQQLRIENLNTELQYLKQQINPHFLFNSLNSIYFQIDKDNTKARDTLHKFSELLRYPLYECNGKTVPLEKEIGYLRNFVDLQRLRKDKNYKITFDSHITDPGAEIYPLLLQPFVENAFKHGSHFESKPNEITINILQTDSALILEVRNTKDKMNTMRGEGIGLKNTMRRLDLLYKNVYQLDINDEGEHHNVKLHIPVNPL